MQHIYQHVTYADLSPKTFQTGTFEGEVVNIQQPWETAHSALIYYGILYNDNDYEEVTQTELISLLTHANSQEDKEAIERTKKQHELYKEHREWKHTGESITVQRGTQKLQGSIIAINNHPSPHMLVQLEHDTFLTNIDHRQLLTNTSDQEHTETTQTTTGIPIKTHIRLWLKDHYPQLRLVSFPGTMIGAYIATKNLENKHQNSTQILQEARTALWGTKVHPNIITAQT